MEVGSQKLGDIAVRSSLQPPGLFLLPIRHSAPRNAVRGRLTIPLLAAHCPLSTADCLLLLSESLPQRLATPHSGCAPAGCRMGLGRRIVIQQPGAEKMPCAAGVNG